MPESPVNPDVDRYRQLRTMFVDRVVANAVEAGVGQFVLIGKGYDPGAGGLGRRWWTVQPRGAALNGLLSDGFEVEAPARFVLMHASQLEEEELLTLLQTTRALASPGSRLALCVTPRALASGLTGENIGPLLEKSRWRHVKISEQSQNAGFVVALPRWAPAPCEALPTKSVLGQFCEWAFYRSGAQLLGAHLAKTYGVEVDSTEELDVGTFRVELRDRSAWVARVFPSTRSAAQARAEAALMSQVHAAGFPVESFPVADPVSVLDDQTVLVTELVRGQRMKEGPASFARLGAALGHLHVMSFQEDGRASGAARVEEDGRSEGPACLDGNGVRRPGGAWHHLALDTDPAGELKVLATLMEAARPRVPHGQNHLYGRLEGGLKNADPCDDLPHAIGHPDLVPSNAIGRPGKAFTIIDSTGMGWYPRIVSLGTMLWAAGDARSVSSAMTAYCESVALDSAELDRLPAALQFRPLALACWSFVTGRETLVWTARFWQKHLERSEKIAEYAREAYAAVGCSVPRQ